MELYEGPEPFIAKNYSSFQKHKVKNTERSNKASQARVRIVCMRHFCTIIQ